MLVLSHNLNGSGSNLYYSNSTCWTSSALLKSVNPVLASLQPYLISILLLLAGAYGQTAQLSLDLKVNLTESDYNNTISDVLQDLTPWVSAQSNGV